MSIGNADRNVLWNRRLVHVVIYFILSLAILSCFRLAFILEYRPTGLNLTEFVDAFWIGFRLDAKWLAISLIPAWLLFILSWRFQTAWKLSVLFAVVGSFLIILLDAVNFGFFGFYASPISPLIFGLFQDDTKAILETLWKDWPIFQYIGIILLAVIPPLIITGFCKTKINLRSTALTLLLMVLCTIALGITCRGSMGKFPLRQEDFAVSPNTFVNASVLNGPAALYESNKARLAFSISGNPDVTVKKLGFSEIKEVKDIIGKNKDFSKPESLPFQPHVVFSIMESMGRDQFESDNGTTNNTLGSLKQAIKEAVVFKKGISIQNGTFPSLEGLLFDTPLTPITQSRYGRKTFAFSEALDFKKAGYRTIFLTSAPERWRQIDETFPIQGFDEVYGEAKIISIFPNIEKAPWGVGDRWLFKTAELMLEEADKKGEKVFMVILSSSNHPPHKVPDGEKVLPVDPTKLPSFITTDLKTEESRLMMQTYQYAADALGQFILGLEKDNLFNKTLIAATGDHNARFKYEAQGYWHHGYGVPILFWVPSEKLKGIANQDQWVSHWDIFPTLKALALGQTPNPKQGRNLFSPSREDGALTFNNIDGQYGFVIGKFGLVSIGEQGKLSCYRWNNEKEEKLIPTPEKKCSDEQIMAGELARAQRALSDYIVRSELLGKE